MSDEKSKVEQALSELNNAKSALRADKQELQQAYNQLIQPTDLNNKKPASSLRTIKDINNLVTN